MNQIIRSELDLKKPMLASSFLQNKKQKLLPGRCRRCPRLHPGGHAHPRRVLHGQALGWGLGLRGGKGDRGAREERFFHFFFFRNFFFSFPLRRGRRRGGQRPLLLLARRRALALQTGQDRSPGGVREPAEFSETRSFNRRRGRRRFRCRSRGRRRRARPAVPALRAPLRREGSEALLC